MEFSILNVHISFKERSSTRFLICHIINIFYESLLLLLLCFYNWFNYFIALKRSEEYPKI